MVFITRWHVSMRPPCASGVPLAAAARCCRAALMRAFFAGGSCFVVICASLESARLPGAGVRFFFAAVAVWPWAPSKRRRRRRRVLGFRVSACAAAAQRLSAEQTQWHRGRPRESRRRRPDRLPGWRRARGRPRRQQRRGCLEGETSARAREGRGSLTHGDKLTLPKQQVCAEERALVPKPYDDAIHNNSENPNQFGRCVPSLSLMRDGVRRPDCRPHLCARALGDGVIVAHDS